MRDKNRELKAVLMLQGVLQKTLAEEMGMNYQTFRAKMNGSVRPNNSGNSRSYVAYFKPAEKEWLAKRLGISSDLIE